jgi:hypothetical protein
MCLVTQMWEMGVYHCEMQCSGLIAAAHIGHLGTHVWLYDVMVSLSILAYCICTVGTWLPSIPWESLAVAPRGEW